MTMQMPELMRFEDEMWSVQGISGLHFFKPKEYGLDLKGSCTTGCYRGYFGTYQLHDGRLHLQDLEINLDGSLAPPLYGVSPVSHSSEIPRICGYVTYSSVALPIPFTGGLLLCRESIDIIDDGRKRSGPDLLWGFGRYRELVFTSGRLLQVIDPTSSIMEMREEVWSDEQLITINFSNKREFEEFVVQYKKLQAKLNSKFQFDY